MLKFVIRSAGTLVLYSCLCGTSWAIEPDAPTTLAPISIETVSKLRFASALQVMLADPAEAEKPYAEGIAKFYQQRGYTAAWIVDGKFTASALAGIDEIGRAGEWGLTVTDFDIPALSHPEAGDVPSYQRLADADLRLSRTLVRYATHARTGRVDPSEFSTMIEKAIAVPEPAKMLDGAAAAARLDTYLLDYQPKNSQFVALRKHWLSIRRGDTEVDAGKVAFYMPDDGPRLRIGSRHPDVAILRKRLKVAAQPGAPEGEDELYDKTLAAAVKAFQRESQIRADGVVTQFVRDRLNGKSEAAPAEIEELLLANMERTRWLPDDRGAFHIEVNIPEFKVRVFDGDKVIHEERVVTGKADTPTPIFSDTMEYVEFNPFWKVPDSIKVGEILPSLRNGGGLSRRGLQMSRNGKVVDSYSVNWNVTDPRLYDIYQPPGPGNVLGVVKFMFPNQHSVYLHDTPSKSLFNSAVRTFSHGCIRVKNPVKLAEVLFSKDRGWSRETVDDIVAKGANQQVSFKRKIPVHITYFTAVVDAQGGFTTFKDPYGVDRKTRLALQGKMNVLLAEAKAERARIAARTHFAAVADDDPGFEPVFFSSQPRYGNNAVRRKQKKSIFSGIFEFDDGEDSGDNVIVIKPRNKRRSSGGDGDSGFKVINAKKSKKPSLVDQLLKSNR